MPDFKKMTQFLVERTNDPTSSINQYDQKKVQDLLQKFADRGYPIDELLDLIKLNTKPELVEIDKVGFDYEVTFNEIKNGEKNIHFEPIPLTLYLFHLLHVGEVISRDTIRYYKGELSTIYEAVSHKDHELVERTINRLTGTDNGTKLKPIYSSINEVIVSRLGPSARELYGIVDVQDEEGNWGKGLKLSEDKVRWNNGVENDFRLP